MYADVASVKSTKPEWGLTILNKLELAVRENLTVISVNPSTFEVKEVFNSCLPNYTLTEMEETRKSRGLIDKLLTLDPLDQQRENLQTFDARLRNALDKVLSDAQKYQEGRRRNILGAIALDKNRYSDPTAYYRIIIYTDGTLKELDSERGSSTMTDTLLIEKYPASFAGADVLIYGIDGSAQTSGREKIFASYLLKHWGRLKSFSPSLPQQDNFAFFPSKKMDGSFDGGGAQGSVKLSLYTAKGGAVTTGWLTFNLAGALLYVPLRGEYRCNEDKCDLVATSADAIPPQVQSPYFREGDKIQLATIGQKMEGTLQPDAKEVFKDQKQSVKYELRFSLR